MIAPFQALARRQLQPSQAKVRSNPVTISIVHGPNSATALRSFGPRQTQSDQNQIDPVPYPLITPLAPQDDGGSIASRTNSSAASANRSSDASPWIGSRPISSITGTASGDTRLRSRWVMRP